MMRDWANSPPDKSAAGSSEDRDWVNSPQTSLQLDPVRIETG